MISVKKAENFTLAQAKSFGVEKVKLSDSLSRVLAENVYTDRMYPPFNRSTMDGVGISFYAYINGLRKFKIISTISAGQKPVGISNPYECVKIMTGAEVPESCDTVIPVEDLKIEGNTVFITGKIISKGQFIHKKGVDKEKGELVLKRGIIITPEVIPILASVGKAYVSVSKLPLVIIISTGDELVGVDIKPTAYQIRRSNDIAINACLSSYKIDADLMHVNDDKEELEKILKNCFQKYDVIIMSGGVSKGEFDYVYQSLEELKVEKIFHGIAQKPGKPMWFGKYKKTTVFALPGNPVSSFMCVNRYVLPYLGKCLGIEKKGLIDTAVLEFDTPANRELTLFTQACLETDKNGGLLAMPIAHNGSGDFMSMVGADVFVELPPSIKPYKKGSVCKIWPIKGLL